MGVQVDVVRRDFSSIYDWATDDLFFDRAD
jgi:hypothetical protein